MSVDRFRVELCDGGAVLCHDPDGGFSALHPGDSYWRVLGAIRQQARDLESLRSDLAAAVAERDTLRAYKAKVEAAPVVAKRHSRFIGGIALFDRDLPNDAELIAKPAKD